MSAQTPREIAFEDIRAGDRIRVEYAESGIKFTREGVAHENTQGGWFASEGGLIVGAIGGVTTTLLHRPAPAEPKGLGAVVRARVSRSVTAPHLVRTLVRAPSSRAQRTPWVDERGSRWAWSDLDPESIEVES